MNAKAFVIIAVLVAGATGWFLGRQEHPSPAPGPANASTGARKIKYYQSPMHPWITSKEPGKCTVCGMDLVPIYEGDSGFSSTAGVVSLSSNSIQTLNVRHTPVTRGPLHRTLRVAGTIDDDDSRHRILSAWVDGRVDRLLVNYVGAEVTEGQPLAGLYSPMLLNAEREYVLLTSRHSDSHGAGGPSPGSLLEAAGQRLRRLGLTPAQIAGLASKPADQTLTEIVAPVTGTVVARFVYEGQYVKEGDRLFELADFSRMWFRFDAYEQDLGWIRIGQEVTVTTPSVPGRSFTGRIAFIDPNLVDATRSTKVRVVLDNPLIDDGPNRRRLLRHRLYADAVVKIDAPETLLVPRSAVLHSGSQARVFIDHGDGQFEQRTVELGRAGDAEWEIRSGLKAGENVVVQGNLMIDSQAQLNQGVAEAREAEGADHAPIAPGSPKASNPSPTNQAPIIDAAGRAALATLLESADRLGAALAKDDLKAFNQEAPALHGAIGTADQALGKHDSWHPVLDALRPLAHLPHANSLEEARKAFHPLGEGIAALTLIARKGPAPDVGYKVYRCPMVKSAFPGAPRTGTWIQRGGPVHNPYFGASMLDCGTEVAP